MKLEYLAESGAPIAVIESFGPDPILVSGNGKHEAAAFVNAIRPAVHAQLGREPNGDEILAAIVAADSPRLRKA